MQDFGEQAAIATTPPWALTGGGSAPGSTPPAYISHLESGRRQPSPEPGRLPRRSPGGHRRGA
ncbi:hypothetical protein G5V59_17085 [Nocardioides sp. W3-2-3]|uniref:hypothetical protein n=1 Tax=Nocardioides convexus TaxID=2712224 RepID=UPI003100C1DD|nr:hypothetical protein [Nocardioides convexus]